MMSQFDSVNVGFKAWLERKMEEYGLTSDYAVERLTGVPRVTIRNYVNGKTKSPSREVLGRLAESLGDSVENLLSFWGYALTDMPKISPLQQELIQTISRLPVERQLAVANFLKAMAVPKATSRDYVEIWGSVSSGGAVEEFSTRAEVQIPGRLIQSIKPHFAIQAADQSLIAAGIRNKDLLLIKQTADRFEWLNQLCVVRVANTGTTLRYWREYHGEVTLEAVSPDSSNFGPFTAPQLECLGVFVGVASPDATPKRRALNGTTS